MRLLVAVALTVVATCGAALAQSVPAPHQMQHELQGRMDHGTMEHGSMDMRQHGVRGGAAAITAGGATQPGQAAFAAIQEIVQILESDPRTDWSRVDIEALRQHLIDMNNVTMRAQVKSEPVEGGMRFTVTGEGAVQDSIRRMVLAHSATMNGVDDWHFAAAVVEAGAILTVHVPAGDLPKLRGLGFIGLMTRGMHHQEHHLMIARGGHPHGR